MRRMLIIVVMALTLVSCGTNAMDYSQEIDTITEVNEQIMSDEVKIELTPEPEPIEDTLSYPVEGYEEIGDEPTEEDEEMIRQEFEENLRKICNDFGYITEH